jgi:hypothetical protein
MAVLHPWQPYHPKAQAKPSQTPKQSFLRVNSVSILKRLSLIPPTLNKRSVARKHVQKDFGNATPRKILFGSPSRE